MRCNSGERAVEVRPQPSVPAASPHNLPAGYTPDELDDAIKIYVAVAEQNIRYAGKLNKKLEKVLADIENEQGTDKLDTANKVTILWDRLAGAGLKLTKATDELTRLRSFLAGGPDSRPDLTVKGELQLQGIVLGAIKMLGREAVLQVLNEND